MRVLRWILWPIGLLLAVIALYCVYALIAYRDIPVEQLEAKYGGADLKVAEVQNIPFRYKITGPLDGSRPVLVLVHSHYWTMRMWDQWVDLLKDQFTIMRYDLTSHGLTGPDPKNDYSAVRGAELLNELMPKVGIEKATIVGSSSGAAIGYMLAANYPERVEKLVIMNAPGMPKMKNKWVERGLPTFMGYVFYLLPTEIFKPFLQFAIVDKSLITDQMAVEFHDMYRRDGNRWAEFLRMSLWEPYEIAKILAPINVPVLVQWGEKNPQLSKEDALKFKEMLVNSPQVEVKIYPQTGHVLPIEKPVESANDVRRFVLQTTVVQPAIPALDNSPTAESEQDSAATNAQ
jgi:pimeloyl-ACP methyl ester carboxylesterase